MRTLESTISIELTPFHLERVRLIDAEDFTGVLKKVRRDLSASGIEPTLEFLEEGILALKQYYVVALLDPCNRHAVSDSIDPFWHAHILHTRDYMAFCDRVFGQYVPHEPLDHDDLDALADIAQLYAYTSSVYSMMFGYINEEFYPAVVPDARLMCSHAEIDTRAIRDLALIG